MPRQILTEEPTNRRVSDRLQEAFSKINAMTGELYDSVDDIDTQPNSKVDSVFGRTGDITAQSGDYSFSQLSGNIANSQVPESIVTQHEGALSILESQISDLSHYTDENARDAIGAALVGGTDISITVDDLANNITIDYTGTSSTVEEIQDAAWAVLTGTQTLISVTYDDVNNNVDFIVDNDLSNYDNSISGFITATLTQEEVQDYVGGMVSGNTETLITVTYQDGDGTIDFVVDNDLSNYDNSVSGFISNITGESVGDLSDVNVVTPADRHVLVYDGVTDNRWENRLLVEADISDLGNYAVVGHTHTESDITDLDHYTNADLEAHIVTTGSFQTLGTGDSVTFGGITSTGLLTAQAGIDITSGGLSSEYQYSNGQQVVASFLNTTTFNDTDGKLGIRIGRSFDAPDRLIEFGYGSDGGFGQSPYFYVSNGNNNGSLTENFKVRYDGQVIIPNGLLTAQGGIDVSGANSVIGPSSAYRAFVLSRGDISDNTVFAIQAQSTTAGSFIDFDDTGGQHSGGRIVYKHDTDSFEIETATTTRVTIDSAGQFGIGTTPTEALDVNGNALFSGLTTHQGGIVVNQQSSAEIQINDTLGDNQSRVSYSTATYNWATGIHGGVGGVYKVSHDAALGTNDYFIIDTSGNVEIPSGNLAVNKTGATEALDVNGNILTSGTLTAQAGVTSNGNAAVNGQLVVTDNAFEVARFIRTSNSSPAITIENETSGPLMTLGARDDGRAFITLNGLERLGIETTTPTATLDVNGDVLVQGDLTVDTDTLFVDTASNLVGIGTTSVTTGFKVDINGDLLARGDIAWNSDRRLKDNIQSISNSRSVLSCLNGRIYERNDKNNKVEIGFVAQEVNPVLPEAVRVPHNSEEMWSMNTVAITAHLVEGWKDHETRINDLQTKISALQQELNELVS